MIRPLATLALAVFALGAAPAPHHAGSPKPSEQLADVRVDVDAGDKQIAPAYAAVSRSKYDTDFPKNLVVRVSGPPPRKGNRVVRFSCVTPGCTFLSTEQPDNGSHVNRVGEVYKVNVVRGHAVLHVTLEGDNPVHTYVVKAEPSVFAGERPIGTSFTLVTR